MPPRPVKSWTVTVLAEYVVKWQEILRLQDWDITIRFAKAGEIEDGDLGSTECHRETMDAQILIMEPGKGAKSKWADESDVELTIVHELMHVRLDQLRIPDERSEDEETVIERLSRILVKLDRKAKWVKSITELKR